MSTTHKLQDTLRTLAKGAAMAAYWSIFMVLLGFIIGMSAKLIMLGHRFAEVLV